MVCFVNYNAHKRDFEIIFSSYDSAMHALRVKLISLAISLNNIKEMVFFVDRGLFITLRYAVIFSVRCAADVGRAFLLRNGLIILLNILVSNCKMSSFTLMVL